MSKFYLVFGDKCFMFVLARPLEHNCVYLARNRDRPEVVLMLR